MLISLNFDFTDSRSLFSPGKPVMAMFGLISSSFISYFTMITLLLEDVCSIPCPVNCQCKPDTLSCSYLQNYHHKTLFNLSNFDANYTRNVQHMKINANVRYKRNFRWFKLESEFHYSVQNVYFTLESFKALKSLEVVLTGQIHFRLLSDGIFEHTKQLEYLKISQELKPSEQPCIGKRAFNGLEKMKHFHFHYPSLLYPMKHTHHQNICASEIWNPNTSFPHVSSLHLAVRSNKPNMCDTLLKPFEFVRKIEIEYTFDFPLNYSLDCLSSVTELSIRHISKNTNMFSLIKIINTIPSESVRYLELVDVHTPEEHNHTHGCDIKHNLTSLNVTQVKSTRHIFSCIQNQDGLTNLIMANGDLQDLKQVKSFPNLIKLDVRYNQISEQEDEKPEISGEMHPNMEYLDLSGNAFHKISENFLGTLTSLKVLNISRNVIKTFNFDLLSGFKSLEVLDLEGNVLQDIRIEITGFELPNLMVFNGSNNFLTYLPEKMFQVAQNLEILELSYNQIEYLPKTLNNLRRLKYLNLHNNKISALDKYFLQQMPNIQYLILSSNDISEVDFLKYLDGSKVFFEISMTGNPLNCSCNNLATIFALQQYFYLKDTSLTCKAPSHLKDVNILNSFLRISKFKCDEYKNCFQSCRCYHHSEDLLASNCSSRNLKEVPKNLPNSLHTLHLDGNQINSMEGLVYPNLTNLSVRHNHIQKLKPDDLKFIPELVNLFLDNNGVIEVPYGFFQFTPKLKHASIKDNNLHCKCEQRWLQDWIMQRNQFITIHAYCSNTSIQEYNFENICDTISFEFDFIALGVVLTLLLILFVFLTASFLHREEIQVYVINRYRKYIHDDREMDEKIYDVFISYSNHDRDLVLNEFFEKLEKSAGYKLCLHERDFLPGEYIADNITAAVENSRRTLAILSNSFMDAQWCEFEFSMAHCQSLRDHCKRLVVVKMDNLNTERLSQEKTIQVYLRTNTFITWGCSMFWEKLISELPATPLKHKMKEKIRT